eukprot:6955104-Prymnesium_polylepis.1
MQQLQSTHAMPVAIVSAVDDGSDEADEAELGLRPRARKKGSKGKARRDEEEGSDGDDAPIRLKSSSKK